MACEVMTSGTYVDLIFLLSILFYDVVGGRHE